MVNKLDLGKTKQFGSKLAADCFPVKQKAWWTIKKASLYVGIAGLQFY